MKPKQDQATVLRSSGNVFGDLKLPDAGKLLAKAELAARIIDLLEALGLSQRQAATRLGIDQPKISRLMRGILDEFSITKLLDFLALLGQDIEIRVRPSRRTQGELKVLAKAG